MRQQRNTKTWFPSLKTTSFLYPNDTRRANRNLAAGLAKNWDSLATTPPHTTPHMHRHLTHLLINRHPLMPASSFTPLSHASHLKSHLSLIMDPENASLPTTNTSRSVLITHTKLSDAILSSEHTLSHPDNKTPSNRLSSTLSRLRHHTHLSSPLYPIYYIYPIYCIYPLYPGHSLSHKKASGDTHVCHPMNVFRIV